MNHQPFETWLLTDEELRPENERALDEHLETCGHCQEIKDALLGTLERPLLTFILFEEFIKFN